MLIFKKARAKNFLSIGNHFIDYDLNVDNLTLYKGKNSMGKSILSSILSFVLFKKPYRSINLPQLVNNINKKDCVAEVEFKINKTEWMIRRGLSPTIFEIYKNGKLLDQHSSVIEQQKWLEQNVLKMNYKTFTQIIVLGTTNFIPFMQLSPADRREIIEELLDIKVFSSMNVLVKDNIKTSRDAIKLLRVKEVGLEEKLELQKQFIEQIKQKDSANLQDKKDKIKKYQNLISELFAQTKEHEEEVKTLQNKLQDYSKASAQLKKLGSLKGKISQRIESLKENHSFFENNDVCPTCSQDISPVIKEKRLKESEETIEEVSSGYSDLLNTIRSEQRKEKKFIEISQEISSLNQTISQNQSKMNQFSGLIGEIQNEINELQKVDDLQEENAKLEYFYEELHAVKNEIIQTKETSEYYELVGNILKDGGVKTIIINKYLPLINKKINEYLRMMDLYVNFTLDGEFNETILTPTFENFSYGNFSEGQKQRINLALTFGLMSVAALKNSVNTNLLILDEILDGSMDAEGISLFLGIIRQEMKNKNIFMISHRDNLDSKFDKVIVFQKKGHFTSKEEIS
jgi:DNA repair exonuclease SbcCD ATPase subunit